MLALLSLGGSQARHLPLLHPSENKDCTSVSTFYLPTLRYTNAREKNITPGEKPPQEGFVFSSFLA